MLHRSCQINVGSRRSQLGHGRLHRVPRTFPAESPPVNPAINISRELATVAENRSTDAPKWTRAVPWAATWWGRLFVKASTSVW
jgi:hypothetical protein